MRSASMRCLRAAAAAVWLALLVAPTGAQVTFDESPPPPVAELPTELLPATVVAPETLASGDASGSSAHEEQTSNATFGLVISNSSNESVDLLEIIHINDMELPRVSFESLTNKNDWAVIKWEDPLTQLTNMITNEGVPITNGTLALDVMLNGTTSVTKVVLAKQSSWTYGPTLLLRNGALAGLSKLMVLEFSNFNVTFGGSNWLPAGIKLNTLTFTQSTVKSFTVSLDANISDIVWRGSTLDSFPNVLLSLKTLPNSLIFESCNFSSPLKLGPKELDMLVDIPNVVFSQNSFPAFNKSECSSHVTIHTQSICVTGADTEAETAVSSDNNLKKSTGLDDIPDDSQPRVASNSARAQSNTWMTTVIAVACIIGGTGLVAGFVWIRRRDPNKSEEPSQLTFTNHHDKFLVDPAEQGELRESALSVRITETSHGVTDQGLVAAATIGGGVLHEVDLGPQVVMDETRLGANGLWRAEFRGEQIVALRVDVENLRDQNKHIESIVESCVALRHPYMVNFIGTSKAGVDDIWLVAELMSEGSLRSFFLKKKVELTWERIERMSLQIASALSFVQSVRGDSASVRAASLLTPKSVLCDGDNCKLDVFDFADSTRDHIAPLANFGLGVIGYRAPELLNNLTVTELSASEAATAEVYVLGAILCELTQQAPLYSDILDEHGMTMGEIIIAREVAANRLRPEPAADTPREYAEILEACVAFNPSERPGLAQVVDWLSARQ